MLQNTFEHDLLEQLAEAEAVDRWRQSQAPTDERGRDPGAGHSLGLLKSELIQVGTIASIVTGLANALESGLFPHIRPHSLGTFSPTYSVTFLATLDELAKGRQFYSLAQNWQTLRAHSALAQSLSQMFIASLAQPEESIICPIEIVADSWRRVCTATLDLHAMLSAGTVGIGCVQASEAQALSLLQLSARGGWPCLGRDGQISIPNWAERRTEPRRIVDMKAAVSVGSSRFPVVLENATTLGFGLACSISLKPLTEMIIDLPDGRALIAYVRWAQAGKVGVRLLEPLAPDDPLLATTD